MGTELECLGTWGWSSRLLGSQEVTGRVPDKWEGGQGSPVFELVTERGQREAGAKSGGVSLLVGPSCCLDFE